MYCVSYFVLRYQLWKSRVNLIKKVCEFPCFINIISSKMNKIGGGNSVRPAISCRVWFWPATRERLPTPDLSIAAVRGNKEKKHLIEELLNILKFTFGKLLITILTNIHRITFKHSHKTVYLMMLENQLCDSQMPFLLLTPNAQM